MAGLAHAPTTRVMRPADIPGGDRLRALANWNQTPDDWARLLCWERAGCFLAEQDGCIVGTVTTTIFGPELAWIGMMLVDPAVRRQGIGRRLLTHAIDWLEVTRRLACIGLDATPVGKTLYDTMGFIDAYTLQRWEGTPPRLACREGPRPLAHADLTRIARLDRAALGVDRMRVIRDIVAAHPSGCFVLERNGDVAGYACSRPGARRCYIGPIVAVDAEAADVLLRAVLTPLVDEPVVMDIVDSNESATRLARGVGLQPVRPFIRMFRGNPLPAAEIHTCFAIVGPEVG
jgi:GNAT superfamily N-acetyltransferase